MFDKKIPNKTIVMEPICCALIFSPKESPIITATIGIRYVTLLAKSTDDIVIS